MSKCIEHEAYGSWIPAFAGMTTLIGYGLSTNNRPYHYPPATPRNETFSARDRQLLLLITPRRCEPQDRRQAEA
ncbi:MAG TPA: hypothetical protein VET30_00100, partial [Pseudoxanthomonas sp.]|nr:hypothetical protein [Pseudoxanthomonas sp.]